MGVDSEKITTEANGWNRFAVLTTDELSRLGKDVDNIKEWQGDTKVLLALSASSKDIVDAKDAIYVVISNKHSIVTKLITDLQEQRVRPLEDALSQFRGMAQTWAIIGSVIVVVASVLAVYAAFIK